ncbi:MAG TPA: tRNA lysidine(34) synthetase TilS [Anaerolineales bacterium]
MFENIEALLLGACGLTRDRLVVVGVSGGPDSLCLMQLLRGARLPILVAHFNHHLREESDAEAAAVEQIARRLGVDFVTEASDVQAHARAQHLSLEEAARHLRYAFLLRQARARSAQAVAVGHTADDQVETVLMHFIRGAGLAGLKGMPYRTLLPSFDPEIPIVRPLLDSWREETVACCAASGLQPVFDPSNDSLHFTRNRMRNALIPELAAYNPGFKQVIWRSVQSLQLDHALIQEMIGAAWTACLREQQPGLIGFDVAELRKLPPALQRGLLRAAAERLRPGRDTSFSGLERAAALLRAAASARADMGGGITAVREGPLLHIISPGGVLPVAEWPQMPDGSDSISLPVPGSLELPNGWLLSCETRASTTAEREDAARNEDPLQVWLDADSLPGALEVRARRPGDRILPLGMGGRSQKISDLMINEKMPARAREHWPLLCSRETIIWVPGYRLAEPYRLHPGSRTVLYLALRRPPDPSAGIEKAP